MATATAPREVVTARAATGAIHAPSTSPHLPVAPDEAVAGAVGAADAGAAIPRPRARDPRTGQPDQRPERFAAFPPRIAGADRVVF